MPFRLPPPPKQPGNNQPAQQPARPIPAQRPGSPMPGTLPWDTTPRPRDSGKGKAQSAKRNRAAHWANKYAAADTPAKRAAVFFDHARAVITDAEKRNTRAGAELWKRLEHALSAVITQAEETPASNPTIETRRRRAQG